MNAIRKGLLVALLIITILPVVALAQLNTLDSLVAHYLEQRPEMAPLIPPLQPAVLKTIETMIRKSDYSFQEWEDWYAGWGESSWSAEGELADYSGQTLLVYEDLSEAAIQIVTSDGKLVATYESEPFPDFSALTRTAADNAFLEELNLRSIMFWVSIENESVSSVRAAAASSSVLSGSGGMAMMSMGGSNAFEVIEIGQTNTGMAVTFAWPATFTNRVDIYSFDGGEFTGRVSWTLADVGYVTAGTNQLRWIDSGQLGRALPGETGVRFYAAGVGAEVDADGDGYGDSYEYLVLHTSTNDPDTDNDLVSDGPFDPDNAGSIVSGPDAFPFDANEWLDTDGDGIGDNSDPDIDGDGIPNGSDPEPLTAGIIAPFKVCSVISTNPPGSDAGDEQFDVSSAGRMLPYASGGNAISGFGRIHGGIYLNHDGTNLYIGVAGYSKTEITDGEDALLLVLDTKSGGVSGLNAINSGPKGLRICDNLLFQAGTFEPDVGILVGNRNSDGRNEPTAIFRDSGNNSKEYGQGVYLLTGNVATNLTPAFTESGPSPISQWGDTPFSTNLANAGIEIAIPLSNLLDNAWSPAHHGDLCRRDCSWRRQRNPALAVQRSLRSKRQRQLWQQQYDSSGNPRIFVSNPSPGTQHHSAFRRRRGNDSVLWLGCPQAGDNLFQHHERGGVLQQLESSRQQHDPYWRRHLGIHPRLHQCLQRGIQIRRERSMGFPMGREQPERLHIAHQRLLCRVQRG